MKRPRHCSFQSRSLPIHPHFSCKHLRCIHINAPIGCEHLCRIVLFDWRPHTEPRKTSAVFTHPLSCVSLNALGSNSNSFGIPFPQEAMQFQVLGQDAVEHIRCSCMRRPADQFFHLSKSPEYCLSAMQGIWRTLAHQQLTSLFPKL